MSVLRDTIMEREAWANRHRMSVGRHQQIREFAEYAALIVLAFAVYFYHDRMIYLVKSFLGGL